MKGTLITVVVLIAAAAAWFFVSPLFIDEVVDEAPIGVAKKAATAMESLTDAASRPADSVAGAVAAMPGRAEIRRMEPAARGKLMNEMMAVAAAAPDKAMDEPMAMAMAETPLIVATGRFVDADLVHRGSGRAQLYRLPDGSHVVRFEDFKVTNGPALVVLLAAAPDIESAADVEKGGYIKLGKLKGNKGNQNYRIPAGIDATSFGSVVIWCELFDVLFSPATLKLT